MKFIFINSQTFYFKNECYIKMQVAQGISHLKSCFIFKILFQKSITFKRIFYFQNIADAANPKINEQKQHFPWRETMGV